MRISRGNSDSLGKYNYNVDEEGVYTLMSSTGTKSTFTSVAAEMNDPVLPYSRVFRFFLRVETVQENVETVFRGFSDF